LPKGKVEAAELLPSTAAREVYEESSTRVRLGAPLTPIRYPVGQSMKIVSWWVGTTLSSHKHTPTSEVDRAKWMSLEQAMETLSYSDERAVLLEAASLPDTTPLIILRHAQAKRRDSWQEDDALRPLSNQGKKQLPFIAQILKPFGVTNLVSSTSTRCIQTLKPYAKAAETQITTLGALSEEEASEREVGGYIERLAKAVGAAGTPTVVCGHAPVIPAMLAPLQILPRFLATASCVIAHLDATGMPVRTEWHDTLRVKTPSTQ